ncbi:hypothetical protein [Desulfurococcus mucosus]|uniref:Uncharacterized protein n=1 Tax=Desulfurococcus mucosus (strain ATCC 35584 / DSM 2162 / JCM 9187 / O7/1) TaxID=765177 RepID=E8R8S7_DESM0|nr:hypothetical protein [Desulfurococcus mucosus]ADV64903.1 protein of unknown function DUF95, transmembrane [Desulfurococcus mucosus DSM 2162]
MSGQPTQDATGGHDELSQFVSSLVFEREGYVLHVLPGFFTVAAVLVLLYNVNMVLKVLDASGVYSSFTIFLLAYLISSTVSTYRLLRIVKKHLYESSVATYYFTRGRDLRGALLYTRNAVTSSMLPSPVTGALVAFFTGAYPVLLVFVEKALRNHVVEEESVLLGGSRSKRYTVVEVVLDLALVVASLGLYTSYMAYRVVKDYNRHVSTIHGSHPNPPVPSTPPGLGSDESVSRVVGAMLITVGLLWLSSYMGVPYSFASNISLGLAWFALNKALEARRYPLVLAVNIALVYALIATGLVAGVAGYPVYAELLGAQARNIGETLASMELPMLTMTIFLNNLAVSAASIVPFGSVILSSGVCNAGLVIGVVVYGLPLEEALRIISVLTYPYAIVEMLAYAVLASSVTRIHEARRYLAVVSAGILLLLLAAYLEASTIKTI